MKTTKITTIIERPNGERETTETLVPEGSEEFHYQVIQDEIHQAIMDKCNEILREIKNMTMWEK